MGDRNSYAEIEASEYFNFFYFICCISMQIQGGKYFNFFFNYILYVTFPWKYSEANVALGSGLKWKNPIMFLFYLHMNFLLDSLI